MTYSCSIPSRTFLYVSFRLETVGLGSVCLSVRVMRDSPGIWNQTSRYGPQIGGVFVQVPSVVCSGKRMSISPSFLHCSNGSFAFCTRMKRVYVASVCKSACMWSSWMCVCVWWYARMCSVHVCWMCRKCVCVSGLCVWEGVWCVLNVYECCMCIWCDVCVYMWYVWVCEHVWCRQNFHVCKIKISKPKMFLFKN